MSLLTTAYLLDKYGPILTVEELSQVLKLSVNTIYNHRSARRLPIPEVKDGKNVRFLAEDVAAYIDTLRAGEGSNTLLE